MKNFYIKSCVLLSIAFMLSNCMSIATLQTAKTTPKGTGLITTSFGLPIQAAAAVVTSTVTTGSGYSRLSLFSLEAAGRVGVTNNLDLGLRFNLLGDAGGDVKYNFFQSPNKKMFLSTGIAINYMFHFVSVNYGGSLASLGSGVGDAYDVVLPLYASYHVSGDILAVYSALKYVYRFGTLKYSTLFASDNTLNFSTSCLNTCIGMKLGRKNAFIMEFATNASLHNLNVSQNMFTVGFVAALE